MIELIAGDRAPHYTHLQARTACICLSCCSAAAARSGCCGRSSAPPAPSPGPDCSRPELDSKMKKCQSGMFLILIKIPACPESCGVSVVALFIFDLCK